MIGLGVSIFRRNSAVLGDSDSLGDFIIKADGFNLLTSTGECLITSVDVDNLVTDNQDFFVTDAGVCLVSFEV